MVAGVQTRRAGDAKPISSSLEVVAPEELTSKTATLSLRYWNALRGERACPAREEIVPRHMASFLRNLVLIRVIEGGRDYEYRIVGEAFVQAYGYNFKGMLLTQIENTEADYGRITRALFEHVRVLATPFALRGWVSPTSPARYSYHETILFPLGKDDAVDHLLVMTSFMHRFTDVYETPLSSILPDSWREYVAHSNGKA